MQIELVDTKKQKVGDMELLPSIFEAEVKESLIHDMVLCQMASRRAGTHSTKSMGEVRGGGRKPWKQKGLGRARAGSIRSPIFKGGGIVFGPKPRDYSYNLTKKAARGALISALSLKSKENALVVIDKLAFDAPKTKLAVETLGDLGLSGKTLLVSNAKDDNIDMSFRNIPKVKQILAKAINVYDLINADHVLITKEALDSIQERLGK
ncbi:LSU ribosomal protein L4p (L1e) [hydrothermal vent metagenome]|uniref:LSU ribosomal protein L4p (L1e) n=1 Tax=hydrothermal vent metagenome TaxID=652676 RepID=A0A3B1C805_9ZZZZ